jgi:hypothetical protein
MVWSKDEYVWLMARACTTGWLGAFGSPLRPCLMHRGGLPPVYLFSFFFLFIDLMALKPHPVCPAAPAFLTLLSLDTPPPLVGIR